MKTLKLVNPGQQDIVKFKAGQPMPIYDRPLTLEEAMGRGAELLERAAQRAVRFLQIGTHL